MKTVLWIENIDDRKTVASILIENGYTINRIDKGNDRWLAVREYGIEVSKTDDGETEHSILG
jgi:hypothetical protein